MVNVRQLLAQKLFGIHSVQSRSQVEIQRTYKGLGAEFGQPMLLLNAKEVFTQAAVFERAYGWSIVVLGYKDKGATLKTPVLHPEKIVALEAYGPPMIMSVEVEQKQREPTLWHATNLQGENKRNRRG